MFDHQPLKDCWPIWLMKRLFMTVLMLYVVIGMIAGYRAYFQIHSLNLNASDSVLRRGSTINTTIVSYARTHADVRVELIQGRHSEVIATQFVPGNNWGFMDPRIRQASKTAVLTEELLNRFEAGQGVLRATAVGREQWTRLPPPVVREVSVEIQP